MATIRDLIVRISVSENTNKGIRKVTASLAQTNRELDNVNKRSRSLSGLSTGFRRLAGSARIASLAIGGIGLAAAGAAVGGVGALGGIAAAVAGIGIAVAATIPEVKTAFASLGTSVKGAMTAAVRPLVPVLTTFAGQVSAIFKRLQPLLTQTFTALSPAVGALLGALAKAITPLVTVITQAARAAVPIIKAIAAGIAPLMAGVSGFLKPLIALAGQLAPVFTQVMAAVGRLLPTLGQLLAILAKAGAPLIGPLLDFVNQLARALVSLLGPVLPQITTAFSGLLTILAPLLPVIARLAGTLITALLPVVPPLAKAFVALATVVGMQLAKVIVAIAPYLPQLALALGQLLIAAVPLVPPLAQILIALTPLIPIITQLVQFVTPFVPLILAWTAAQWLLNAAMSANPITLVVIAIAALIAIIVLVATKTRFFQTIWSGTWNGIKTIATGVWNFLRDKVFGPIGRFFTQTIPGWLSSGVSSIKGKFNSLVSFVTGLPGRIGRAASGMFKGISNAFKGAINWIISRWNNFQLSLGGWRVNLPFGMGFTIPSITLRTPNIPYLATGGLITRAGMAVVGERGPEMVSLPRGAQVHPNGTPRGVAAAAGGGGGAVVLEVRSSGRAVDDFLAEMIRKYVRVVGGGSVEVAFGKPS